MQVLRVFNNNVVLARRGDEPVVVTGRGVGFKIKQGDEVRGHRIKVKVVKNKVAPPFRNTEVDLIYGEGISHLGTILDYATEGNIVQKSGTWFSFDKERLGQGRDNAIRFLAEHTEIAQVIENLVRQLHGLLPPDAETPAEEEAKAASD